MKVALIDASLRPLMDNRRGASIGKSFRPSVELMKVYAYCRREHIEVKMLSYRREMESLDKYSLVVVAKGSPTTPPVQTVLLVMEELGWPNNTRKTVQESLFDLHDGTDLCVVGRGMPFPESRSLLGPEVDSCPTDVDAYGEALYLRKKLDAVLEYRGRRVLDMAYGRIMLENGGWMRPKILARYSGTEYLDLDDEDPSSIPSAVMDAFVSEAVAERYRICFREPIDLSRIEDGAFDALCKARWFSYIAVSGYGADTKERLLRLADACSASRIIMVLDGIGEGTYKDEDHMECIRKMLHDLYRAAKLGVMVRPVLSDCAKQSRFGQVYSMILTWRRAPPVFYSHPLAWFVRWTIQGLREKGRPHVADEAESAWTCLCDRCPDVKEMAEEFCGIAVARGEYVCKEAQRCSRRRPSCRWTGLSLTTRTPG